jgi:hypothetical protein
MLLPANMGCPNGNGADWVRPRGRWPCLFSLACATCNKYPRNSGQSHRHWTLSSPKVYFNISPKTGVKKSELSTWPFLIVLKMWKHFTCHYTFIWPFKHTGKAYLTLNIILLQLLVHEFSYYSHLLNQNIYLYYHLWALSNFKTLYSKYMTFIWIS